MRQHNVSIRIKFHKHRSINKCAIKEKLKIPLLRKDGVFLVRYRRTYILKKQFNINY